MSDTNSARPLRMALLLIALAMPACNRNGTDAGYWQIERERIELSQQLKLAEYRMETTQSGGAAELAAVKDGQRRLEKRLSELQRNRSSLEAEIQEMESRNEEFARLAIENRRAQVIGRKFASLPLKDGRVLENVSVASVDDSGVAVRHEHGAARLRYADLTPGQQVLFGLEAGSAQAAETREQLAAAEYDKQLGEELQTIREKEERRGQTMVRQENRTRISSSMMARNSASPSTRALAKPATSVGSGSSWYGYSRYRNYRPTYRYIYYSPSVPNPFYASRLRYLDPLVPTKDFTKP